MWGIPITRTVWYTPGVANQFSRSEACKNGHPWEGDNFYINSRGQRICRVCNRERNRREWAEGSPVRDKKLETARESAKRRARRDRQAALDAYGRECQCCGESNEVFLAVDHVDGGGNEHRRSAGIGGSSAFYRWLRVNGYPDGFQVLCHNCNYAKHALGVCPHVGGDAP